MFGKFYRRAAHHAAKRPRSPAAKWIKAMSIIVIGSCAYMAGVSVGTDTMDKPLFVVMLIMFMVGLSAGPFAKEEFWGRNIGIKYDEFELAAILRATRISYRICFGCIFAIAWLHWVSHSASFSATTLPRDWSAMVIGASYIAFLLPSFVAEITIPIVDGEA